MLAFVPSVVTVTGRPSNAEQSLLLNPASQVQIPFQEAHMPRLEQFAGHMMGGGVTTDTQFDGELSPNAVTVVVTKA